MKEKRANKNEKIIIVQQFKAAEGEREKAYIEKMAKAITLTEQRKIQF